MRFNLLSLCIVATVGQGCATFVEMNESARQIKVFRGEAGKSCKKIYEIESIEDVGDFVTSFESARNYAMNQIASAHGNAARFEDASWQGTEVHLLASGFRCSGKANLEIDEQVTRPRYGSRFLPDAGYQREFYEQRRIGNEQMLKASEKMGRSIAGFGDDGKPLGGDSYSSSAGESSSKQTDFQCLSSCTQNGYSYGLCLSKCSY